MSKLTRRQKQKLINTVFETIQPALNHEDYDFDSTEQYDAAIDFMIGLLDDIKGDFETEE